MTVLIQTQHYKWPSGKNAIYKYILSFKTFGISKIFNCFEISLVCLPMLKNAQLQNRNIVKYYKSLQYLFSMWIYFKIVFIAVMHSCYFQHLLLQSSVVTWSSEIILIWWFAAQETFLIIINVENSVLLHIIVETIFTL